MFYLYVEEYSPVWEPAEGGYYVETSEVSWYNEYEKLEDAVAAYREEYSFFIDDGCEVYREGKTYTLGMPWCRFDSFGYIGEGFSLAVSDKKPQDYKYEGYC